MGALSVVPARTEQNRCRSSPQQPVEPDAAENSHGYSGRIDVCQISAGIHQRHEEQRNQSTCQGSECKFYRDLDRPARAAVSVGQMSVAAGTSCH